jgi:PAS domain S-box-containing protein
MHTFSEERQKLKVLVDNSPDFMGISNNDGVIEYLNKAAYILLGIDKDTELQTLRSANFYALHEAEHMHEIYQAVKEKGSWKGNVLLRHFKTGELIPGYGSYETIIDPVTGGQIGKSTTVRDLRPELGAQKALRDSEAMFRNVTQNAPTGLWMSDTEGGLIYLNKTLVDWTGMPYEALLGTGWANAIIEEDRQRSAEIFLAAVNSKTHYDVEFRITKKDGSVCWCRAAGDPYQAEDGSFAGYVGFCMDIHQRVEMAIAVHESEERVKSIVDQAPVAIGVLKGKELVVESGNKTILKVWGKDASIIGKPILEALPEIKGQGFVELLESVYNTGTPFNGNAVLAQLEHNGKIEDFYFDFVYAPVKDAGGIINGVLVVASDVTKQILARQEVEVSEAKFKALIEEAPVPTAVLVGRALVIDVANETMLKLWDKRSSIIGMPLAEALPELEGQPFLKILDDIFTTGKAFEAQEARAELLLDGKPTTYYFNYAYKPLFDNEGKVYAIIDMAIDVTEQVLAKQKIEKSQRELLGYFEDSPVAIAIIGKDNLTFKMANSFYGELSGRKPGELVGKALLEALPELKGQGFDTLLQGVIATGDPVIANEVPVEIMRNSKLETIHIDMTYQPRRDDAENVAGVLVVCTDVTQQVNARKKIEEAEEALRGAIDLADLGTWSLDLKTRVLDYDARLRKWFGFTKDEVITADKAYTPIAEADRPLVRAAILHAATPGTGGIYDIEYHIKNLQTGLERILHAQGKTFLDDKGEACKITGTVQDVTKERKIELELTKQVQERTEELAASNEELQAMNEEITTTSEEMEETNQNLFRSNEELSQYAYVASHDLQEPLRKIRVYSGMLSKQKSLSEENKPLVDKINQSSERMSLLIKDLLEFSRLIKSEKMLRPVNLNETVKEVITDFELIMAEKKAGITIAPLPVIDAVALQMNQLFYNIISNALKFIDPDKQPAISIGSTRLSPEEIRKHIQKPAQDVIYHDIFISDNGIGFDVKYADQIFEVFKRLHGKDIYPGSGIGLALCRRIVTNHGGYLYAESQIGTGTTFHIILPELNN